MDTPAQTSHGKATRVAKPDLFYGDRHELEGWLLQWDLFFKFEDENVDDVDKACLVASYMRGWAQTWVKPYLTKYLDSNNNEDAINRMFNDFEGLKEKVRQSFKVANESLVAERAIQRLKQTKSAGDYANEFQRYSIQTEWNDAALMRMYRQGLKDKVRMEILRSGAATDTLDQLIEESIRIDNELYEFELESRAYQPRDNKPRNAPNRANHGKTRKAYKPKTYGHYQSQEPEPMHIDTIQRGKPKNFGKQSNKRDKKQSKDCYNCGKPGHFARDCRQKNKVVRHLNVLHKVQMTKEQLEEWEMMNDSDHGEPEAELHTDVTDTAWGQVLIDAGTQNIIQRWQGTREGLQGVEDYRHDQPKAVRDALNTELAKYPAVPRQGTPTSPKATETNLRRNNGSVLYNGTPEERKETLERIESYIRDGSITIVPTTPWDNNDLVGETNRRTVQDSPDTRSEDDWSPRKESPACRPSTPHPGNRVPGCWDNESDQEDQEKERILTLEELSIHTPPASPKLVRQNATLQEHLPILPQEAGRKRKTRNSAKTPCKRLVVDGQEDWVEAALKENAPREPKAAQGPKTIKYLEDPRNPNHGNISWLACHRDNCMIHYASKIEQSYFPQYKKKCRYHWFDCPRDVCAIHLYDKREATYFPGPTENHLNVLDVEGKCFHATWQRCPRADCVRHFKDKEDNGYGTSKAFLGSCLAPGIDPGQTNTAPESSSPSQ